MGYWFDEDEKSGSEDDAGDAPALRSLTAPAALPARDAEDEPNWLSEYKSPAKPNTSTSSSSSSSGLSDFGTDPKKTKSTTAKQPGKSPKKAGAAAAGTTTTSGDADNSGEKGARTAPGPKAKAASSLPLVMPERISRTKVLVECPGENEATDLDGDIGAVGRFNIVGNDMQFDLKGVIYTADVVPSQTFFVVNVGTAEARVEAMMNDFIQLHPKEDTLDEGDEGFHFGDDDDFDSEEDERDGKKKGGSKKRKAGDLAAPAATGGADEILGDRDTTVAKPKAKLKAKPSAGRGRGGKAGRGGRGGKASGGGAKPGSKPKGK